jgi:ubiquinone/menaquinone biosynthesis C-methylase UbiE
VRLLSFDIYASAFTTFVADAHRIPVRDASIDGVWVQAVLEHVLDPVAVVAEIRRTLKPGAWVYAETPFMQQVHEGPFDFTRFTHSGHRWLFRDFDEVESGSVAGAGTQLAWALEHFGRALTRSRAAGKMVRAAFFWLRWLDALAGSRENLDAASVLFFFGCKGDGSMPAKAVPSYYRGADHV